MSNNKKDTLKSIRSTQRSYLNRDFDSLRSSLTQYASTFFSDRISDFSSNGVAGMLIELTAYVGDVMSYYIDHQFQELDLTEAVETKNVERLVRNAGVKITGASPAVVDVEFYMQIPAIKSADQYIPDASKCPIIKAGTIVSSGSGIKFTLVDDIHMGELDSAGNIVAQYATMTSDSNGNPKSFSVKKSGTCVSASTYVESFSIPNKFKQFRTITLGSANVSEIVSIVDAEGNEYYEVQSLTQDTVFRRVINISGDQDIVPENLELIPAPRRFISTTSNITKKTSVRFGGGSALSTSDDIMPDPSSLSLPLYGERKTLSSFTIDPNRLISTTTLGISPQNTTLKVMYRAGGGVSHNVADKSIRNVFSLVTKFKASVSTSEISSIRSSLEVINPLRAAGGESAPTIDELRSIAIANRNSQDRIVTKQDLIARVYTMPNKFGRVFRVGVRSNPNNPLASVISIVSRDSDGNLSISPDTLKENLRVFLNESRLISDAIDIVDAPVVNLGVNYGIAISGNANPETVIQTVNTALPNYFVIENFQIDQPIMVSDAANIILNIEDVVSLISLDFVNRTGIVSGNEYSGVSFSVRSNTVKGMIMCPEGGIFEIKYPNDDIVGSVR
jgi:hypothetical protein